jgi:hypothetical protein
MPRLTVTATPTKLAGRPSRKSIVFRNRAAGSGGLTAYWGFEDTITPDEDADTCGVPILAGEEVILPADNPNLGRPLYFVTAAGSTFIFYTEN